MLAACGSTASTTTETTAAEETAALSGSVSTNGSTSMEKVINILAEQFMVDNLDMTVTYDPTGSGTAANDLIRQAGTVPVAK